MKFGIMAPYQLGPVESGDYARAFARLVEELGFESVWAVEHAVMCVDYDSVYPYDPSGRSPFEADTVQPDPLIWLSWVAAATERLRLAIVQVMRDWLERLRAERGEGFPVKVTAFRKEMAVHGRYGEPCPVCASPVQRLVYAANEANYCATCQTGGKLLADRALSRLLKKDWPKSLEELEQRKKRDSQKT